LDKFFQFFSSFSVFSFQVFSGLKKFFAPNRTQLFFLHKFVQELASKFDERNIRKFLEHESEDIKLVIIWLPVIRLLQTDTSTEVWHDHWNPVQLQCWQLFITKSSTSSNNYYESQPWDVHFAGNSIL